MTDRIPPLLAMLERGKDSALLRFSIGNEYLAAEDFSAAISHLAKAVELDDQYSAAWKLLGNAYAAVDSPDHARTAYTAGIEAAENQGDRQAAKEMTVFMRRLDKKSSND